MKTFILSTPAADSVRSPFAPPSPNAAVAAHSRGKPAMLVNVLVTCGPKHSESTLEGGFTLQRLLPRRVAGWITSVGGFALAGEDWKCSTLLVFFFMHQL